MTAIDMTRHDFELTLHSLARAVLDLADGMGGDDQEQTRAQEIANTLYALSFGHPVAPLQAHDAARAEWFGVEEAS